MGKSMKRSKPIARSTEPIKRRKYKPKPKHPRIERCVRVRCSEYSWLDGVCKDHIYDLMDMLARDHVRARDGECQDKRPHEHKGDLQWAHTMSRTYLGTRWLMEGAVILCAGAHSFYGHRWEKWDAWCGDRFGMDRWIVIKAYALRIGNQPFHAEDARVLMNRLTLGPVSIDTMMALEGEAA